MWPAGRGALGSHVRPWLASVMVPCLVPIWSRVSQGMGLALLSPNWIPSPTSSPHPIRPLLCLGGRRSIVDPHVGPMFGLHVDNVDSIRGSQSSRLPLLQSHDSRVKRSLDPSGIPPPLHLPNPSRVNEAVGSWLVPMWVPWSLPPAPQTHSTITARPCTTLILSPQSSKLLLLQSNGGEFPI